MANLITVPVLKTCHYHGRTYARGDWLTAEPIELAALAHGGYVTLGAGSPPGLRDKMLEAEPPTAEDLPLDAEPPAAEDPPLRRRYRRRDLEAER